MRENDTLKTVTALLGVGVVGFLGWKYFDRKAEEEEMNAKLKGVITDANASGKSVLPTVKDVVKDLKTNPKNQTFSVAEYKQLADSLYQYLITKNQAGILRIFGYMKTNQDVKLLSIYFGVKVYKQDEWHESFKVNTWNLSQFMSSDLVMYQTRNAISKVFKQRKITYTIW
ncbi:MAG: hypothetical protein EKK64_01000 [Neisseriaceae bacterium]|nr:MAG: hypothetical protein EKK64_01000 [Neisseriaceae bacterium]